MFDSVDLLAVIKKSAVDAFENVKPVNIVFGRVDSVAPLSVNIENKLKLFDEQIIISDLFRVHEIACEVDGKRGIGRLDLTLKSGDDIILFRMQGGQKYIILDRIAK